MKRHRALIPLSQDHHHALVIARRLRHATEQDAVATTSVFLEHWEEHEKLHFRLEEEVLLPAYAAHGEPGHPTVLRTLLDHLEIRRDVAGLTDAPSLEMLHQLGVRLAAHVELEERELFPLIERTLPEAALADLHGRLRAGAR